MNKNETGAAPAKAAHTPGPWASDGVTVFADLGDGLNACDVAVMINDGVLPLSIKQANARLIAAAPAMLEALRELVGLFQGHMSSKDELTDALNAARAAIAAATGEAR
jgi:hypothetical protein